MWKPSDNLKTKKYTQMKKLILFLAVCVSQAFAQDVHFSQYEFSPLMLNPALTSVDKHLQAAVQHKDQWRSLNGYRTSALSFEMKFDPKNWIKVKRKTEVYTPRGDEGFAFGINVFSDVAGDGNMKQLAASFVLAYHLQVSAHSRLSTGIKGGFIQKSISPEGLRFNSQYTPDGAYNSGISSGESFSYLNFINADFAGGILYSYNTEATSISANDQKSVKAGFSMDHLNRPGQTFVSGNSFGREFIKCTFHANAMIGIHNTPLSIGSSALLYLQGVQKEAIAGILFKYSIRQESKYTGVNKPKSISVGCYYRMADAVIPTLLYEFNQFSVGISYDVNASGLSSATWGRGGVEIGLRFFNISPFLYQNKVSQGRGAGANH